MGAQTYSRRFGAAEVGPLSCIILLMVMAACTPAGPPPAAPVPTGPPELVVLVTSDMHGRIHPTDDTGSPTAASFATLAPIIDSLRAAHLGPVVLIDAGGSLSGSVQATAFTRDPAPRHAVLRALELVGYDAAVVKPADQVGVRGLPAGVALLLADSLAGEEGEVTLRRALPEGDTLSIRLIAAPASVGDRDPSSTLLVIALSAEPVEPAAPMPPGADLVIGPVAPGHVGILRAALERDSAGGVQLGVVRATTVAGDALRMHRPLLDSLRRETERALLSAGIRPASFPAPRVRVVATSDLHGKLLPSIENGQVSGGAAVLAASLRADREGFQGPTLLLDAGDALGEALPGDAATIAFMDLLPYDAATAGTAELASARDRVATFPWLSANVVVAGSDTAPAWARPAAVLDAGGVRVGVVGITSEGAAAPGLRIASGAAALDRWVTALRGQGAEFVVALAHGGAGCERGEPACRDEVEGWIRAAQSKPDLVVAGNTHRAESFEVSGVPVVSPGAFGLHYAVIDLAQREGMTDVWIRGIPSPDPSLPPDRSVGELISRHLGAGGPGGAVAVLGEPIVRGAGEHSLGRLVTDAYRWAMRAHVAIESSDAFLADLAAGVLMAGAVSAALPAGGTLSVLQLSGPQLRRALEAIVASGAPAAQVSGVVAYYDPAAPVGSRILTARLEDGRLIGDTGLFTIAVPERLAGTGVLSEAIHRRDAGIGVQRAVLDYARGLPQPVSAPRDPRLRPATGEGGGGRS